MWVLWEFQFRFFRSWVVSKQSKLGCYEEKDLFEPHHTIHLLMVEKNNVKPNSPVQLIPILYWFDERLNVVTRVSYFWIRKQDMQLVWFTRENKTKSWLLRIGNRSWVSHTKFESAALMKYDAHFILFAPIKACMLYWAALIRLFPQNTLILSLETNHTQNITSNPQKTHLMIYIVCDFRTMSWRRQYCGSPNDEQR